MTKPCSIGLDAAAPKLLPHGRLPWALLAFALSAWWLFCWLAAGLYFDRQTGSVHIDASVAAIIAGLIGTLMMLLTLLILTWRREQQPALPAEHGMATTRREYLADEHRRFTGKPSLAFEAQASEGWPLDYVSPNLVEQFAPSQEALPGGGMSYASLVHPDDLPALAAALQQCSETGQPRFEQEYRMLLAGGGYRWVHAFIALVRDAAGTVTHYHGHLSDITERKQAELQLKRALEFTEGVINAIPDILLEVNAEGRYLNVWTHSPQLLAAQKEVLLGKTVHEVLSPEGASIALAAIAEAEARGISFGAILPVTTLQGEGYFELSVSRKPIDDPAAEPRFLVLSRDVTDRVRMAETLATREREMRTITEHSPDAIVRYDLDCRSIYANPNFERLCHPGIAEKPGATPSEQLNAPPAITAEFTRQLQAVMATGKAGEIDLAWEANQGPVCWLVRLVPEFDAKDKVHGALAIWSDITERKAMEEALRASEREFRTLAENTPDQIIRYEAHGKAIYMNSAAARLVGVPPSGTSGHSSDEIAATREITELPGFSEKLQRVLHTGEAQEIEAVVCHPEDGRQIHNIRLVAERDDDGRLAGALMVGRNITELKEAEHRLRESYDLLQKLTSQRETAREAERKRIAREIHDELGQQLSALKLKVNLLSFQFGQAEPTLKDATRGLLVMVDQTIQVARNVSTSLRPSALDMGVAAALEWLAGEFQERTGILCELDAKMGNFPVAEEQSIALFRIAQESLTNVMRHANAKRIDITLKHKGSDLVLEITDDGIGFDPATAHRQKFGLLGMRERVLAVGGKTMIDSTPGKGTRVSVTIPLAVESIPL